MQYDWCPKKKYILLFNSIGTGPILDLWAAFGFLIFIHYAFENPDFLKASLRHGLGMIGGITALYYLLTLKSIEGNSILYGISVFTTMALLLGYHLYIGHVPSNIGTPFALILIVILVDSSYILITKHVSGHSTETRKKASRTP